MGTFRLYLTIRLFQYARHTEAARAVTAMNNIQHNGRYTRASWNLKPKTEEADILPLPVEYFDIQDLTTEQRHEILWCVREYEKSIEKYKKEKLDNVLNFIYDDLPPPTVSSAPKIIYSHKVALDYRNKDPLYKTQMCKFYERGNCQRGSSCQFAHSRYELQKYADRY